ncbi:MAG TPA: hypothetical protein VKF40_19380 [Burkholderiales bacterium]|nr:hypothetical protein [Burkholderiales bacterium]
MYMFLALFLFLGFWLKVVVQAIWFPGFVEATGGFSGKPTEWDAALLAASCGALGAALPRLAHIFLMRRTVHESRNAGSAAPLWFARSRRVIWMATIASVLVLNAANLHFAFFQIGVNPTLVLPYHLNVPAAWLINIGFALWIAVLAQWDFHLNRESLPSSVAVAMVEALASTVSALSRLSFLLHAGPYFIVLAEHWRTLKGRLSGRRMAVLASFFVAGLAISVLTVFWLRVLDFHAVELDRLLRRSGVETARPPSVAEKDVPPAAPPQAGPSTPSVAANDARLNTVLTYQRDVLLRQLPALFVHRWVGLEGVLVVGAVSGRGRDLFIAALTNDPKLGADSLFQQHAKTNFLASDAKTFTFLSNSGIIALLFYSDSFLIVMAGMAMITAILMATERLMELASRNTFLLAVAGAASANVVCQMTFPYLVGVFLAQLWVAIAFLALVQHTDVALSKLKEPPSG